MTIKQLVDQLISDGGAIVSSNDCSEMEIAFASAHGRFATDAEGFGFVRRTKEWLSLQKKREIEHPNQPASADAAARVEPTKEENLLPAVKESLKVYELLRRANGGTDDITQRVIEPLILLFWSSWRDYLIEQDSSASCAPTKEEDKKDLGLR